MTAVNEINIASTTKTWGRSMCDQGKQPLLARAIISSIRAGQWRGGADQLRILIEEMPGWEESPLRLIQVCCRIADGGTANFKDVESLLAFAHKLTGYFHEFNAAEREIAREIVPLLLCGRRQ